MKNLNNIFLKKFKLIMRV